MRPLAATIGDVGQGCHSFIEVAYARNVERDHGLPYARRQRRRSDAQGVSYDDASYDDYGTVVAWRRVLRYGLGDVEQHPCLVAAQLGRVLWLGGWTGRPRRCTRPGCTADQA